eukprot:14563716-Ditylum_brightwellii.AAC.1
MVDMIVPKRPMKDKYSIQPPLCLTHFSVSTSFNPKSIPPTMADISPRNCCFNVNVDLCPSSTDAAAASSVSAVSTTAVVVSNKSP